MQSSPSPLRVDRARWLAAAAWSIPLAPLLATITWGAGLGVPAAAGAGLLGFVAATHWLRQQQVAHHVAALTTTSRWLTGAALILALLAAAQTLRVSAFMIDPALRHHSALPFTPFFVRHSCLSSYTEAVRFAADGTNVYDPALYEDRRIEGFEVDVYQYPPPFLAIPASLQLIAPDFLRARGLWFGLQGTLLWGCLLTIARWVGGRRGGVVGLLSGVVWIAPQTLLTLQMGNFHITTIAGSILALVWIDGGRRLRGGALLGLLGSSKLFPLVVLLPLVLQRRWRVAVAATAACLVATAGAVLLFGWRPLTDFVAYQLPRIADGRAFSWMSLPSLRPINHSIEGLVAKLDALGAPGMGRTTAELLAWGYLAALGGLGLVAARRTSVGAGHGAPLERAVVLLALLNLASFRSPFVPDAYAFLGTIWLSTWLAASSSTARRCACWLAFAFLLMPVVDGLLPRRPSALVLGHAVTVQVAVIAANVWAIVRAPRHRLDDATEAAQVLPGTGGASSPSGVAP